MRYLYNILIAVFLLLSLSCSKEEVYYDSSSLSETTNLINYDKNENYKGSRLILIQENMALKFSGVQGLLPTDNFIMRSHVSNTDVFLSWGYLYSGIQGDENGYYEPVSDKDSLRIGLGFKDNWEISKYDLLLVRGNQYQVLDQFDLALVNTETLVVDSTKVDGGQINITGEGFIDSSVYGDVDSLVCIEKATGNKMYSLPTRYTESKPTIEHVFNDYDLSTGKYELYIKRWNYGLIQKLFDFDFFRYEFVNSTPLQKNDDGLYVLQFTVDNVNPDGKDRYSVFDVKEAGNIYYDNGYLTTENWDKDTKIYTLPIKDLSDFNAWWGVPFEGMKFKVDLSFDGGASITVSGDNYLSLE